ncbi:serine/threonine protein kinase [Nostoc sp. UHCC 0302]|uniref:serine/threonine protein kinase n=1 Tax=Nostoc sp. UHCC 0302 TaxID=3134896 RepID=UPI00311CCB03
MDKSHVNQLVASIYQELLPSCQIESVDPHNPVKVYYLPEPWRLLGTGNYAAVVYHPDYPDQVIKIYAPGRPGFTDEVEVYHRLGSHSAFSECFYAKDNFLVLKRLYGITLYDSIHRGLRIPKQVIQDIDEALYYARSRGLNPHDIHGRNVMMHKGRGLVVDISDFLVQEPCLKWNHLKKAYYWLYLPFFYPLRLQVPYFALDIVRKTYRLVASLLYKKLRLTSAVGQKTPTEV